MENSQKVCKHVWKFVERQTNKYIFDGKENFVTTLAYDCDKCFKQIMILANDNNTEALEGFPDEFLVARLNHQRGKIAERHDFNLSIKNGQINIQIHKEDVSSFIDSYSNALKDTVNNPLFTQLFEQLFNLYKSKFSSSNDSDEIINETEAVPHPGAAVLAQALKITDVKDIIEAEYTILHVFSPDNIEYEVVSNAKMVELFTSDNDVTVAGIWKGVLGINERTAALRYLKTIIRKNPDVMKEQREEMENSQQGSFI